MTPGDPPPTCRICQMVDPPPEQTCIGGWDHWVGLAAGCPACGRLTTACQLRPCSTRREQGATRP